MPLYETVIQEKPPVVLDIGVAYTKIGVATEAYPRKIIPSQVILSSGDTTCDIFSFESEIQFRDNFVDFFQTIFFKHLSISPKERKIIIVENVFNKTLIRETIARVLFRHFEVSSILFVPSHLAALSTLAVHSGIVVDMGYNEVNVLPIFSGVQILPAFYDQPFGGKMIHEEIKRQLIISGVKEEDLTETILEDIKVRTCFVTTLERANKYRDGNPPVAPPDVKYQIGDKDITIPGIVRETAFEIMFVEDNERCSLPYLILNSILKCSMDVRKMLAENILIIGGTAIIPGLLARIKSELNELLKNNMYKDKLFIDSFKYHKTVGSPNFASWLGGSLCGGTEIVPIRSLTKEMYMKNGRVPDWINLIDNNQTIP